MLFHLTFAQNYDSLIDKAVEAVNQEKYCEAFDIFKMILVDSTIVTPYDYYTAAISATGCNDNKQALLWLSIGQRNGLGLNEGDIPYIEKDNSLVRLHTYEEWPLFISEMKNFYAANQAERIRKEEEWMKMITTNTISPKENGMFSKPNKGTYALYFTEVDSIHVPYFVYVATTYKEANQTQAIIYLHGGVASQNHFQHTDPGLVNEPIFTIGETTGSIIIYPLGKKSFGWVKQVEAFENIFTVLDSVKKRYNLDTKKIYLGGMSNGGTATFWFASQKNNIFKVFFAISAIPKLEIGDINFGNLSQGKPFYSLNAKNDRVFLYNDVLEIYNVNRSIAKDWHFETIDTGGHGFIYEPDKGVQILNTFLNELVIK